MIKLSCFSVGSRYCYVVFIEHRMVFIFYKGKPKYKHYTMFNKYSIAITAILIENQDTCKLIRVR